MNNIPTAEQFLMCCDLPEDTVTITGVIPTKDILIEFTKYYVEAALKAAAEKIKLKGGNISDCQAILNSYPLNNIK